MIKICLVPLCGLPASGKTKFSNELIKKIKTKNVLIISYDDFINLNKFSYVINNGIGVKNEDERNYYKNFRIDMLNLIEFIVKDLKEFDKNFTQTKSYLNIKKFNFNFVNYNFNQNFLLIIDDNNYYRSMRYEFYKLAKKYQLGFFQIFFHVELEKAILLNSQRNDFQNVPSNLIKRMKIRLELPNRKNFWEMNTIFLNDFIYNFDNIEKMVNDRLLNPETIIKIDSYVELSHRIEDVPKLHEIDLILRKRISELIKLKKDNEKNYFANEINEKRKQILYDLRRNIIEFPNDLSEIKNYL